MGKDAKKIIQLGRKLGSMDPAGIFYDSTSGAFLVDVGQHYRKYSRKTPVMNGVMRFYENEGYDRDDAKEEAKQALSDVELSRAVDWCGALAGHKRGLIRHPGAGSILVTSQAQLPEPKKGEFNFIAEIVSGLLSPGDPAQVEVAYAWMKGAYESVRAGMHQPAPLLAVAGAADCGKSLLAWVVKMLLGGRVGHPHCTWSGGLLWNDDLIGAELLLIDDSVGSTDYRARINFASNFKESVYGDEVQMRKRNTSSMSVRPVWRAMACVNDVPESLEVLPPLTEDMRDKMILLRASKVNLGRDAGSPEGRKATQEKILAELPALAHHLTTLEVPDEFHDPRAGVRAWRHPELVEALEGLTPAAQLRELIVMHPKFANSNPMGEAWTGTAAELESILIDRESPTAGQARTLLRGPRLLGRYLSELAKLDGGLVRRGTVHNGLQRWVITTSPESYEP